MKINKTLIAALTMTMTTGLGFTTWNSRVIYAQNTQNVDNLESMSERSKQIARERIEKETEENAQLAKTRPVAEALSAVEETRKAIKLLEENQADQARASLQRAIEKTDIVLANHPNLTLVPVVVDVRIVDMIARESTIKSITDEAKNLMNRGQYQAARILLKDLASEIDISTINLPISTYPDVLRIASGLIEEGKIKEARTRLLSALQSLVVLEMVIPLPVVRAQALIDETSRLVESGKIDKGQASQFLSDADQQLVLAEKLGYATRKDDFSEIRNSIKSLKNTLDTGQDSKGVFAKIKQGLMSLRERMSKLGSTSSV